MQQCSIQSLTTCYGVGIHSGDPVSLILKPAPVDTGIVFVRTDLHSSNIIKLEAQNILHSSLCTTITNGSAKIATIEHLLAALCGCNIDNIIIEINGAEVPIMDGSSYPFVFMLNCAGIVLQNKKRKYLKLKKEIYVEDGESFIHAKPFDQFHIDLMINFSHSIIGKQEFSFSSAISFEKEVSKARTFGFIKELDYLKSRGLALGASLENAIALDDDHILNAEGLRYQDEFVRHKLLDTIGDLYCDGHQLISKITSSKSGHALNNQLLQKILLDSNAYEYSYYR